MVTKLALFVLGTGEPPLTEALSPVVVFTDTVVPAGSGLNRLVLLSDA